MPPAESRVFMQTLGGTARRGWLRSFRVPSCWAEQANSKPRLTSREPSASLTWSPPHRQLTTTAGTLRNSAGKPTPTGRTSPRCCLFYHKKQTSQLRLPPRSAVAIKQPRSQRGRAWPGVSPLPLLLFDM